MKNNIGDLVAQSMLNVLNSKEHASIFKKAYKVAGVNCNYCGDMGDCSMCGDMASDGAMIDDNMYVEDVGHDFELEDSEDSFDFDMVDDNWDEDASMSKEIVSSKTAAYYDAMQDLITASAALDYADFDKASELSIKIAALVAKTKEIMDSSKTSAKGKKPGKGKKPAKGKIPPQFKKKMNSGKSTPSSSSSPSSKSSGSSSKSSEKKMTMDEKMKMLRSKMKK